MPKAYASTVVDQPADRVWAAVRDFNGLPTWFSDAIERSEIGLLKAFGYSNAAVGWHYAQLVIAISSLGVALGIGLGAWFGRGMTGMYAELYRFPFMIFRPSLSVYVIAGVVSGIGSSSARAGRAAIHARAGRVCET